MTAPAELGRVAHARRYVRHRYAVVGILCVMYFITYVDRVNLSLAAPDLTRSLRLTKTELGFLFSVFAYPYAAMQVLGGWFSDKYGPRLTLTLLGVIWSAATIWTGLCGGFATLLLSRVLLGVVRAALFRPRRARSRAGCPKASAASLKASPTALHAWVARSRRPSSPI